MGFSHFNFIGGSGCFSVSSLIPEPSKTWPIDLAISLISSLLYACSYLSFCFMPVFQQELDTKHDKYERLVKISRDITIESKRTIFLLHRVTRLSIFRLTHTVQCFPQVSKDYGGGVDGSLEYVQFTPIGLFPQQQT